MKDKFSKHGMYNATGFIFNMTKGVTVNFEVSSDGIQLDADEVQNNEPIEEIPLIEFSSVELPEKDEENIIIKASIADFVDSSINPQHYVDRYYNEKSYKSWFDKNYPKLTIEQAVGITDNIQEVNTTVQELTIEQAVGITDNIQEVNTTVQELINKDIIPEAEALIVQNTQQSSDNSEIAQILVAIAALGILFGTVYGVKRSVDSNSRQISINRDIIRKKIIQPILGSNPKEILQTRLAKGEITLDEYEKINSKLS